MRIAIAGASGFVGRRLTDLLAQEGHEVVAMGRRAEALPAGANIDAVAVDIADEAATREALRGAEVAYYLVHSMTGEHFEERDRANATSFAYAARDAGVRRIAYVGALGSGDLSPHLASRQEVGDVLRSTGLDVVELRAAVVLGAGSISFEMLRYLVERLPAMVCPRWVRTPIQPIALSDLMHYLVAAIDVEPGIYGIGIERSTSYREMMDVYARARGLRRRVIVDVPLLTLTLSSYWVDLVTPVDRRVSHTLIESLASPVTVDDPDWTEKAFGFRPMPLAEAMRAALEEQADDVSRDLLGKASGLRDGVHVMSVRAPLRPREAGALRQDLAGAGGALSWYGWAPAWRLRMMLGRLVGERTALHRPDAVRDGERVDWWTVASATTDSLVLRTDAWRIGEGWMGYRVEDDAHSMLQVAALRPKGVPGFLYWQILRPIHRLVFARMLQARLERARRRARR